MISRLTQTVSIYPSLQKAFKMPSQKNTNHVSEESVVTSIPEVPVTSQRQPFLQPNDDQRLPHTGKKNGFNV